MKLPLCLLTLAIGTPLFADDSFDEYSFPETIPCANGNILFSNVGNYSITPAAWFCLSTNSNYMVTCQIAFENTAFPNGPSATNEITRTHAVENCLNLELGKFLQKTYAGMSEAELVRKYRSGFVRAKVEDDFPIWFDKVKEILVKLHQNEGTPLDEVSVLKVSMRAVGPFAEALDAL